MSCKDISTLINTILHVYMSTQGVLKSIYNGKESILTTCRRARYVSTDRSWPPPWSETLPDPNATPRSTSAATPATTSSAELVGSHCTPLVICKKFTITTATLYHTKTVVILLYYQFSRGTRCVPVWRDSLTRTASPTRNHTIPESNPVPYGTRPGS